MEDDALGRAMFDYHRDRFGRLRYRDGAETREAPVRTQYFLPPDEWSDRRRSQLDDLDGPILDVGCGAGKHALYLQNRTTVVALDVSRWAVATARERGVEHALVGDMFDLPVGGRRYATAQLIGTQIGLAGSLPGVSALLNELARVTTEDATAVIDNYDPTTTDIDELLGHRSDPRDGVARRTFHFEYELPEVDDAATGRTDAEPNRIVGRSLDFVLFGPDRLRDAFVETPWRLESIDPSPESSYYRAVLAKR